MKRSTWKSRDPRTRPKSSVKRAPRLESLECRHLLSVAVAEIDSTSPADGDALLKSPQQFVINFDPNYVNQIDDLFSGLFGTSPAQTFPTLVSLDNSGQGGNNEFEIDQVGAGGVITPVLGGSTAWPLQASITTTTDANGNTTQSQMILTPAPGDPTLLSGTYQLSIQPWTNLDAAFGFLDTSPVWSSSQPTAIAQFTVLGAGKSLSDATSLGNVGTSTQSVSGFINPRDAQSQVGLYQITLPQGQRWLLNAQVFTQLIGSPLQPGLALFDSSGNLLATSTPGQNLNDNANLSKGLAPGTYYIAVSQANNMPGLSNSYNLQESTPGIAGFNEPSGAFRLDLSADPVLSSTKLTSSSLTYADPLEPSPTGINLTFSAPIDVTSLFLPDQQETAVEVVNASGQVWPISAKGYQSSTNTLSFVIDQALPAGSYSLILPAQGGLTDLYGLPVVTPAGNPPGVLASWTVAPSTTPTNPNNLSVIWPGPVNVTWNAAVGRTTLLTAGQETSYRFVVIVPGIYAVQTQVNTGEADLQVTNAHGSTIVEAKGLTGLNNSLMNLTTGTYTLNLTDKGSQPALVLWTLNPISLDYEKILQNGVSQLVTISVPISNPTTANLEGTTTNSGSLSATTTTATYSSSAAGSAQSAFSASPIPASLLVSMNTSLMGLPETSDQGLGAVGPMAPGALAAVADRLHGLLPGIRYSSAFDAELRAGNGDSPEVAESVKVANNDPPATALVKNSPANPESDSIGNDGRALARADQLLRMASWIESFLGVPASTNTPTGRETRLGTEGQTRVAAIEKRNESREISLASIRAGLDPNRSDDHDEGAMLGDLSAPIGLILAAAVVHRFRRPLETWWRRKTKTTSSGLNRPHLFRVNSRGPHCRPSHMQTTFRPRMPRTPC